ncbi:MAG TPA: phosphatidylglycerol lysyltransferase domain-containing protein [Candidatus Binatia bacterium]|nr:phosphatidylglycerol lysyltransferase domain-containing protein [Candidatus Binatia bacterium]
MRFDLTRRRYLIAWQLLFLILGTTWLLAPHLNSGLSYRTSLISQYETPAQPFSWAFRTGDVLGGLLLLLMAYTFLKHPNKKIAGWLLLILGIGLVLDPLLSTTCRMVGSACKEYTSPSFVLHAVETVATSLVFFVIAVYDAWLRKKLVSIIFVLFQVAYGVLFVSQLADHEHFNTVSQYVYQTVLIVWLAWFCRDYLIDGNFKSRKNEEKIVTLVVAAWAFINGILAILISLAHIHLLGKIKGLYFAGDSAWLAQHGVIIGVVMLYLSRHLARGETRARQIFLVIAGIETLKYSVISPNPGLMILYLTTFCALFVLKDDFDRGLIPLTWKVRLKDLYFMVGGLLLVVLLALILLDRDSKVALVTAQALDNFSDYASGAVHSHMRSVLLANTITAFLAVSAGSILWILFKPYKPQTNLERDYGRVERLLKWRSNSSEDFFKLWPADKDYFWQDDSHGFIAYKLVGSTAFALADPMADDRHQAIEQFIQWAKGRRLTTCFLPIYKDSVPAYKKAKLDIIQIGASAVINIDDFLQVTTKDKWWRWQKNRASKNGYIYAKSLPPHSDIFLRQLKAVSDAWLTKDGRKERGFALGYFDNDYLAKCTLHYLHDDSGKILAFTNQIPHFCKSHTVSVDLLRYLPDANNAMPYLLYKTIESVSETEHYKYFDLGFVPFAKAKGRLMSIARTLSGDRFSAQGLEQFKNKFNPDWHPNYMAYDGDLTDLAIIALNLEKAMEQNT